MLMYVSDIDKLFITLLKKDIFKIELIWDKVYSFFKV